jgi:HEAT repeat protein
MKLGLLIGQSFSLGAMLALLIITANSLFLVEFGAGALPYVYITVAVLGSLLSYGFTGLQRRWALPRLALATLTVTAAFLVAGWLGTTRLYTRWASFALIVSFSFLIQIGFILLGAQAGRLFDVRQIKRLFPRIVAGFVGGFMIGALLVPGLVRILGRTENVLLGATTAALLFLLFAFLTSRRFREPLGRLEAGGRQEPGKSLLQLLRTRFVLLIFVYQLLAAMISQLADYILLAQAGARYADSEALAGFFSTFTVALNAADLLFLTVIAGYFLSRFGLGAGLLANPVVLGLLFAAVFLAGLGQGTTGALFFTLVVIARITNITLTDGSTRTAVNAAYQALPPRERVAVQTGVEGIGAPLALGVVGILLLIVNALGGVTIVAVVFFTLLLIVLWGASGLLVYRHYAGALFQLLRRRALDEADLSLADGSSLAVVDELLRGGRLSDVRLALDLLEADDHPGLDERLIDLVGRATGPVRVEALARVERRKLPEALPAVRQALAESPGDAARGAALQALCALLGGEAAEEVVPYLDDSEPGVRRGALVGLLCYGGIAGVLAAGRRLMDLAQSPEPGERRFAAEVIGAVEAPGFHEPLLPLLADEEPVVRRAALLAAARVAHPRLLPRIVPNLAHAGLRSAAATALAAQGKAILPVAAEALDHAGSGADAVLAIRLVRVCAQIAGPNVIALLEQHLEHPDEAIRHQVLAALSRAGYRPGPADAPAVTRALEREAEAALRLLVAQQSVGQGDDVEPLRRALQEALTQLRQRLFLLLSFLHESEPLLRAGARLPAAGEGEQALILEMLDVSLPAAQKELLLPLVDPKLSPALRIRALQRRFTASDLGRDSQLQEIIADPDRRWSDHWIRACALYAAGRLGLSSAAAAVAQRREDPDPAVRETAGWAAAMLNPEGGDPAPAVFVRGP